MSDNVKNEEAYLVEIENLSFAYDDKEVLSDINMKVPKGIIMGVIGPNGGGKTTLLKIILGLLKGYKGAMKVNCMLDPNKKGPHHHCIGYVPQKSKINSRYPATVYDTVEMGLYGHADFSFGGPTDKEKKYIQWLLEETGTYEIREKPISEISGGQMQRTLIARALVGKPSLLLLDEPLVGIDQTGVMQFIELLMLLKKHLNLTVIMTTHNIDAVATYTDKVACLNRTVHIHENPEHLDYEQVHRSYACDYEAYSGAHGG